MCEHIYQKVHDIHDIFKNFFGEDNVDLQEYSKDYIRDCLSLYLRDNAVKVEGAENTYEVSEVLLKRMEENYSSYKSTIYVWWSQVTITNENDRSVNIQDLYAKIEVQMDGRIPYENAGFLLNRATYPREQFLSNYMHSHIHYIPKSNFTQFMEPCLGKGPIKETIGTLKNEGDEVTWMLFCDELAMYVTVESLAGVPWKYLEQIGHSKQLISHCVFTSASSTSKALTASFFKEDTRAFIGYYLRHGHLTLCFRDGKFQCGMSYYDYIIDVSNAFIDYFNTSFNPTEEKIRRCFNAGLLLHCKVRDGHFYSTLDSSQREALEAYQGKPVLTFKGRKICVSILDTDTSNATESIILDHGYAMYVLNNILRTINFRYKNEHIDNTEGEPSATTGKRLLYI